MCGMSLWLFVEDTIMKMKIFFNKKVQTPAKKIGHPRGLIPGALVMRDARSPVERTVASHCTTLYAACAGGHR